MFWELETVLPDEANQIFTVSYTENGESFYNMTTESSYNLTELITGEMYTISVILSYAYTAETSNKSITIIIPQPQSNVAALTVIIPVLIVVVIILLVGIIVLLVIVIFCQIKKRCNRAFKTLNEDDGLPPITPHNILVHGQVQPKPKPHKARGKRHNGKKSKTGGVEYASIEEKSHYDMPLEVIPKTEPNYTTIDETMLVPLEGEDSRNTDQSNSEEKQIYYSNLGKFTVKQAETYKPLETQFNDKEYVGEQSGGYSRVDDIVESDRQYTPMMALETKQLPKQPITTSIIPAKIFIKTYRRYIEASTEDGSVIKDEFNQIKETSRQSFQDEIIEGIKPENKVKNPIEHTLPFEDNRVVLESPHIIGNYINASFIDSYQFIATMHPTSETLVDFLQMLYQTEASMVVMLASRKEKAKIIGGLSNRKAYWPREGMNLECHPFTTNTISTTDSNAFIKQELKLTHNVEKRHRTVMHCISAVWNEDNTASNLENVVALLIRIIKQKETAPLKPIIIHCADGISKTGVLLTIYSAVQELSQRKTINIHNAVKKLRRQRMQMVPTLVC